MHSTSHMCGTSRICGCTTNSYAGIPCAIWLSRTWGWCFVWSPEFAHRNIKAVLQEADRQGLPVLGLGALNKAEFVNGGGARLIEEVQPKTTRLVHGNTLTGPHS